jgi:integrase
LIADYRIEPAILLLTIFKKLVRPGIKNIVTNDRVTRHLADHLQGRITRPTWRRLLAPAVDFGWLAEIEKDLALVMEPRSKLDRLVFTPRLMEAGLALMAEAQGFANSDLTRARGMRNGLMIALLALCPIRIKNFAALQIGRTFKETNGGWWIALPGIRTKSHRPDERS